MIELHGICKRYDTGWGRPVVAADDVSLTNEAGEFVELTGASGAGKITLLNFMGAVDRPDAGTVRRDGTEVTALCSRPCRRSAPAGTRGCGRWTC